jgi:NAD+ synthase (glutamine-hydrolysing)
MKIALAQLNFRVADFENNRKTIIDHIERAKKDKADLVVFSELSVCGYPPLDFLELRDFYDKCTESVNLIAESCKGIAAIVGAPNINTNPLGKRLYNTAWFLNNGKVEQTVNKTLLPTYDVFDEYRYFESNRVFNIIDFKGKRIALTICEDLWDDQPFQNPFGKARLYTVSPLDELARQKPDLIINIAASPFSFNKEKIKKDIFTNKAAKYGLPLFYVNQTGANTELIFDGGSMVIDNHGKILHEMATFSEDYQIYDLDEVLSGTMACHLNNLKDDTQKIHDALILGIRDYFRKSGFKKATLGLSGGIDSAVTLALAVEALGAENVRVLLMPSKYSSDHSITDAIVLAENLGVRFDVVSIESICHQFDRALLPVFAGLGSDITEENIQARARGVLMMALSNKLGHILLNTSNKSEAAVGYGTLYGDMCGGISVLGDVYKTRVYALARYINREKEIIPNNSIIKPPSAELRPDQKDSDSLPEYEVLDPILEMYIEEQLSAHEIVEAGNDPVLVARVIQMVNRNEYKRFQTPPILRVSSKAFGMGRRMPIVGKY